jgi:hypothetical protein
MNNTWWAFATGSIAAAAVAACQSPVPSDDPEPHEDLQALLHDQPLTQIRLEAAPARSPTDDPARPAPSEHREIALPDNDAIGLWSFDDCDSKRTALFDSSFLGNTAFRSIGVACSDGIQHHRAVAITSAQDILHVPDQPNFTFEGGVTVAGWFRPAALGGNRTLFRKRDKDTSSFALMLNSGRFEFIVNIGDGHAISVIAPSRAKLGSFQHVAGSYDGTTARLYVDGVEVNNFAVPGTIPSGAGPLVMGNDGSRRWFSGAIDHALFATHALTADQVLALTCFPRANRTGGAHPRRRAAG